MEKCIKSKVIYKGKLLDFMTDEVVLDDGTKSTREYVKHPGGVCILGFVDGKIILEKQFRYPYNEVILELPAGKLESNESPIDAAKREFEEETGYKVNNLISLGTMYPTLAYTNEVIHLFYADNLSKGEKHLDFDERIDLEFFSIEEIKKLIETNKIKDAKTICLFYKFLEYVGKR